MKIIDKYLWKATLTGLLIAWFALVILDVFFAFISEAGSTNDEYTTLHAIVYLIYTLPSRFYEHFPTSILIGALLGLGGLAANSEFVAMRAAGISIKNITFSVIRLGLLLAVFIFAVGEWVVPHTDLHARNFKAHLKNKNITLTRGNGLWIKESNRIIHIKKVLSNDQLADISIYSFTKDFSGLASIESIDTAKSTQNNQWQLSNINTSVFAEKRVNKHHKKQEHVLDFIDQQVLATANSNPEQLSASELKTIIKHQKENQLKTDKYELIYWKRYSIPLSALVMLILSMPFLFGSNRGGGAGQRVFIGIVVGIVFSLANRSANDLGLVYGFSPFMSAFLPSFLFLIAGLFFLNRIR